MNALHVILMYMLWGIITFFFMVMFLTLLKNRKALYQEPKDLGELSMVSIIVPAYNEENSIRETIESLLSLDYPRESMEIIVVNDGSSDRTKEIAEEYVKDAGIILINKEINQGKSAALNTGIGKSKGGLVACIDADTIVNRDVIRKTLPYFGDKETGAVVVRVRVKNPRNWLGRIIEVEYNLGLGFYMKLLSFLNSLYLTPGQFSIYRKSVLEEIGGFDERNIVEDTEIAYRIQKARYRIECCLSAEAFTKVPDNLKAFYYQRKRWYSGTIMTVLQHRDVFFNRNLGNFGIFFMPVNYIGILLGVLLFISTINLGISILSTGLSNFALVGYDPVFLWNSFTRMGPDILSIRIFYFFGSMPFLMNMIGMFVGLRLLGEKVRKNIFGFICFLFFFIVYHVLWILSGYFVVFGKEIGWRG